MGILTVAGEELDDLVDWVRSRHFGKYRGVVTDNADTASKARLKVRVPAVLGDLEVWAMPCVPYAGDGVGFYSLPEAGTGVWVEFEAGDPSFAIWSGCFWGDGELPDDSDANVKIWKTTSLSLRIDDGAEELAVESTAGATFVVGEEVVTESGQAKLTVGSDGVVGEMGSIKAEVGQASFKVNDGALEVM
jgi:hypothetical protein